MPRCPKGTRKNNKTGLCEPIKNKKEKIHTETEILSPQNLIKTTTKVSRCPKGTRKNSKTGLCEPIKNKKEKIYTEILSPKNTTEKIVKISSSTKSPRISSLSSITSQMVKSHSSTKSPKVTTPLSIKSPKVTSRSSTKSPKVTSRSSTKSPKVTTPVSIKSSKIVIHSPQSKESIKIINQLPSNESIKLVDPLQSNDSIKVINPLSSYSKKIAAFDLDDTLINTKSGKKLAKEMTDWKLMNDKVKPKLQELVKNGYSIIIFTNQKGIGKSGKVDEFEDKIKAIKDELGVNLTAYVSLKDDYNRKPFPGMFEYHTSQHPVDKTHSFYVGDAYSSVDAFSDSDYKFALNNKIPFYIADNYFKEENPTPYTKDIKSPIEPYYGKMDETKLAEINKAKYILLVSPPASGKSTFCAKYLPSHLRLSKDDYSTPKLYKNAVKDAVSQGKSIVFDNTHATQKSRDEIISMLPKNAEVLYVVRNIPKDIAMYLNRYRYYTTHNESKYLPDIAIHVWYKNYEEPTGNVIHLPLVIEDKIKDVYV